MRRYASPRALRGKLAIPVGLCYPLPGFRPRV